MPRRDRHILWWIVAWFGFFAGLIALAVVAPPKARAHDKWWNGQEIDPRTKQLCCGDHDIKRLDAREVRLVPGGYELIDVSPPEFFPHERTQPSPDGEFWVFRWGGEPKCFFAPLNGS